MKRVALAAAAAAIAASVVAPSAQQKVSKRRASAGFVLGRVIDADTGQPVAGATVTIAGTSAGRGQPAPVSVIATASGDFLFRELPPGNYGITVTAPGYLRGGLGQRRVGGPTQTRAVDDGERVAGVIVRLWREATLAGTVRDETGDPVARITVALLDRRLIETSGSPRPGGTAAARFGTTDAAGAYRFSGLLPGEYVVSIPARVAYVPAAVADADAAALDLARLSGLAALGNGLRGLGPVVRLGDVLIQTSAEGSAGGSNALAGLLPVSMAADGTVTAYPPAFFSGVHDPAAATTIRLVTGENRAGVDIRLSPVRMRRVSGRIESPDGPLPGLAVHLIPRYASDTDLESTHETSVTLAGANGEFMFPAVPPGEYILKAWRLPASSVIGTDPLPAMPTLWARQPVVVGAESVTGLRVVARPGSSIRGRIVQEGSATPLPASRLQTVISVAFEPDWRLAFGARLPTRVSASMEFVTQGLPPGEYFPVLPNQFSSAATGWYFESAVRAGRDLMLEPLTLEAETDVTDVVIVFSDRRTTMTGTVMDASGRPMPSAGVVMFPAEFGTWIARGLPPLASWAEPVSASAAFSFDARPGDYLVAAIDEARLDDWRREAVVRELAGRATRVTLARGDTGRADLRVVVIREAGGGRR